MILNYFYKHYIPKNIREETGSYSSAKNLIGACIISLISAPIYALIYYLMGHYVAVFFILSEIFFVYGVLLILKYSGSVRLGAAVLIGSFVILLTWLTYTLGGISSPAVSWLIIPPLAATLISGVRIGIFWCVVSVISVSFLFSLENLGVKFPTSTITHPLLLQYISLCGLITILFFLAYFYEAEKRRTLKKLHYLAYHDPLTDLPNRIYFKKKLNEAILKARTNKIEFALLFLDFDNFKVINDTLGHNIGDQLLREAGRRLKQCIHPTDRVCRIGGDEFNLIITSSPRHEDIELRALAILTAIKSPFYLNKHEANITVSIGIAMCPKNSKSSFLLNRYADIALYESKKKGGDNFQFFTKALEKKEFIRVEIERKLPYALIKNEFYLNYQPIFDTKIPTKIVSIEGLLRWKNKELGVVPPDVFIPIAERTGMISIISNWALREACHQYVQWLEAGLVNQSIALQINISVQQLNKETFINNLKKIVTSTKMPYESLILELTETEMFLDLKRAIEMLNKVKDLGINIAIDDFGIGYTSLRYLNTLPINTIKIDKSFIKNMHTKNNARIIAGLINLGHSLKLKVIAEGIEKIEHLNFLAELDCDLVQGFYLSKPLSSKNMQSLLIVNKAQNAII